MKPEIQAYIDQCAEEGRSVNIVYLMRDAGLLRAEAEEVVRELAEQGYETEPALTLPHILERLERENLAKRQS